MKRRKTRWQGGILRRNHMTKAEEYLRKYEWAVNQIRRCEDEYKEELLQIDAIRSSSDNDGMPHGSGISKPTEDKAEKLSDKAMRLVDAKLEAVRVRQEVFDTIMAVGGFEADVLIERYVNLKTWECVCLSVNYTWPTVRMAWHRGLDKVEELIK